MRGVTVQIEADLVTEICCQSNCGILFAVPAHWQQQRRRDHSSFYCPNGHPQNYMTKTNEEKLRDELATVQRRLDSERGRREVAESSAMNLAKSRSALRGVVTKLRNKAVAGECAFCHQQFPDVAEHVAEAHPGVTTDATETDEEPEG